MRGCLLVSSLCQRAIPLLFVFMEEWGEVERSGGYLSGATVDMICLDLIFDFLRL